MKDSLKTGVTMTRRITVDRDRTISFMGEEARVYSTPALLGDIEYTCRDLLLAHLDGGEDSVGTRVELDHLAATPLGLEVEIAATIEKLEGRAVTFSVTARDTLDEIGRCRHARFVVDTAKTKERVTAKAAKAKAA